VLAMIRDVQEAAKTRVRSWKLMVPTARGKYLKYAWGRAAAMTAVAPIVIMRSACD
jgi:hypothetical protein